MGDAPAQSPTPGPHASVLVLPAELVPLVRSGAFSEYAEAARKLADVIDSHERPKGHAAARWLLEWRRALLDVIGWEDAAVAAEQPVSVDLYTHCDSLLSALRSEYAHQCCLAEDSAATVERRERARRHGSALYALVEPVDTYRKRTGFSLLPGERLLTAEEFQQHFGHLPTDGEG